MSPRPMTIQPDPDSSNRALVLAGSGSGGIALVVYLATMNPTYGFIDKGELAAVATTLGIAHPTGYPTLTLIGHAATRLSPLRPVLTLNILACVLTAIGVGLMAVLVDRLLRLEAPPRDDDPPAAPRQQRRTRGRRNKPAPRHSGSESVTLSAGPRAALAAAVALCVAFATTWWGQATGFEVYALQAALLPLVTLLFLGYVDRLEGSGVDGFSWPGTAFAFILGICFSNHMATVMLAPAFLFLYFRAASLHLPAWRRLLFLIPGFLLGLVPYTYLLVRARMAPRLNWGNPSTLASLLQHVMGKQFQFAMKYEPRVFGQQTAFFWNTLANDTVYLGLALAAVGIVVLFRRNRTLAIGTALLFATCLVLSGLYDINDIGNYYLSAVMAIGIALAFGLAYLAERMGTRAAIGCGAFLAILSGGMHFRAMNESGNFLVEDLTHNLLGSLPTNAVVFSGHWDYWTSGALYAQEVEGFRRDVLVLDPESLRSEWYLDHLVKYEPRLMTSVPGEASAFRTMIRRFEHEAFGPADADQYFTAYFGMIGALIERNLDRRPFFVTDGIDDRVGAGYQRVPGHLVYRLSKDTSYAPEEFPQYRFRSWRNRVDPYVVKICELYTMSLLSRARYEEAHGHAPEAKRYGIAALGFDPGFPEEDVPDYPLHIEEQMREIIRNYKALRERARLQN